VPANGADLEEKKRMPETAMVAKPGQQAKLDDWLRYADDLIRVGQLEYLGKCKVIVLEASRGANVPGLSETSKVGVRLDWRNDDSQPGRIVECFMRIAQSLDRRLLLALDPVVRSDGQVGLPDIPDPAWVPGQPGQIITEGPLKGKYNPTEAEVNAWKPGRPTMLKQDLVDRATGRVEHTNLLVFQPVHQIMFQPEINGQLQATYWTVECGHEPGGGTQMAFLVDAKTGRAYFYGGRYVLNPVG
jgi:hypothetical protein